MRLSNLFRSLARTVLPSILALVIFQTGATAASDDGSTLPFAPAPSASIAKPRLQDSTMRRRVEKDHLPRDAPNILIILLDDVGFGLPDTYGGPIHTPNLSRVANEGISYNTFHTTSICSPTFAGSRPCSRPNRPRVRRWFQSRHAGDCVR